jgi:hypothetical protein
MHFHLLHKGGGGGDYYYYYYYYYYRHHHHHHHQHVALQSNTGYGLLIHEVFEITHTTRHSW